MKKAMSVAVVVALVGGLVGVALAHGPGWGPMMGGGRGGMTGGGWGPMMGHGGPAYGGSEACPAWSTGEPGTEAITEEKAKDLATEYANKYFAGFTVERVLPFTGRFRTMYQVELRGPKGETRYLHVNPWGGVRPFGPLAATD